MTKAEEQELAREVTIYRIQEDFGKNSGTYRIDKVVACVEMDTYHVQLKPEKDPWCDCMGFRRQNFEKDKHKHVVLARDYVSRGKPEWAEYTIKGTGHMAQIEFIRSAPQR
jgi:hypothetical protein